MAQWDDQAKSTTYSGHTNGNGSALTPEEGQVQIQELIENARAEVDRYVSTAADFIRERPVACVAGALAVGFLVGKFASRK
jgi:ElaB/YqjD/DUF883 family membrane-anchored ribosome-binding protein